MEMEILKPTIVDFQKYVDTNKDKNISEDEFSSIKSLAEKAVKDPTKLSASEIQFLKNIGLIRMDATSGLTVNTEFSLKDLQSHYDKVNTHPTEPPKEVKGKIVDDEMIRELMKLLLQAFLCMIIARQLGDLNDLNGILNAFAEKFAKMESEAKLKLIAGCISGGISIGAGSLSIASGVASGISAGVGVAKVSKLGKDVKPNVNVEGGNADAVSKTATTSSYSEARFQAEIQNLHGFESMFTKLFDGLSQILKGGGDITKANLDAWADTERIEAEKNQARVEFWKQGEQMDSKAMDQFFSFLQQVLSILAEYRRNITQTEQGIARNI